MKFYEKYTDANYIKSDDCRKIITLKDKGASKSTYICENNKKKRVKRGGLLCGLAVFFPVSLYMMEA